MLRLYLALLLLIVQGASHFWALNQTTCCPSNVCCAWSNRSDFFLYPCSLSPCLILDRTIYHLSSFVLFVSVCFHSFRGFWPAEVPGEMARPGSTGGKSSTAGSLISHPSHGVAELLPRFEDLIPSSYFARTVFLEPTTKVITVHQTILWFWARLLPEVKRQTGLYGFAWQCQMSTCIQVAKYARMPGTGASRTIEVSFFAHFLRRMTFCPCEPWPVLQLCHLHTKGQNWDHW